MPKIVLLLVLVALTHGLQVGEWPGLHYDEAWAALFSARISQEPGFWPLHAMSPYTMPWPHYWTALCFHFFGISMAVYRASQLALVLGGLACLTIAIKEYSSQRSAQLFLVLAAICPMAILNHRFAIELTSFHVLCAGLFMLSLQKQWPLLLLLATVLGVSAHLLFLAVPAAVLLLCLAERIQVPRSVRQALALSFFLLLPFFLKLAWQVPEKKKAIALLLVMGITAVNLQFFFAKLQAFFQQWQKPFTLFLQIAALPFLLNLLFFVDGHWNLQIVMGRLAFPWTAGVWGVAAFYLLVACWNDRRARLFMAALLVCLGSLMLKPTARYFELGLLMSLFLMGQSLARLPRFKAILMVTILAATSSLAFWQNVYAVWQEKIEPKNFHLAFLKDSSNDFLPKQKLAKFLGLKACDISGIRGGDPRVLTALQFLSYGDWPKPQDKQTDKQTSCPVTNYRVELQNGIAEDNALWAFGAFRVFEVYGN